VQISEKTLAIESTEAKQDRIVVAMARQQFAVQSSGVLTAITKPNK